MNQSTLLRTYRANRILTNTCIGTAVGVFGTWSYARRGLVYDTTNNAIKPLKEAGLLPKAVSLPNPTRLHDRMQDYFILDSSRPNNYASWIGSAFSHTGLGHIVFNMITWSSFAPMLYLLPTRHYAGLIFGSAIASSATYLYDKRGTQAKGLGASGIVSGIMASVTMFMPTARARVWGILPMPLWALTGSFFLLDAYFMQADMRTGIGHSAHVGGGVFGVLYYAVFLRKYRAHLARGLSGFV